MPARRNPTKHKTLQDVIQYFSDEQTCIDTVAALRWPNGITCPVCEGKEHYYLPTRKLWKCTRCRRQFSVKIGTIFQESHISLCKWLAVLWMLVNYESGISGYEVSRHLGVSRHGALSMLHRLRLALHRGSVAKPSPTSL